MVAVDQAATAGFTVDDGGRCGVAFAAICDFFGCRLSPLALSPFRFDQLIKSAVRGRSDREEGADTGVLEFAAIEALDGAERQARSL
jgi:hypothetical protein